MWKTSLWASPTSDSWWKQAALWYHVINLIGWARYRKILWSDMNGHYLCEIALLIDLKLLSHLEEKFWQVLLNASLKLPGICAGREEEASCLFLLNPFEEIKVKTSMLSCMKAVLGSQPGPVHHYTETHWETSPFSFVTVPFRLSRSASVYQKCRQISNGCKFLLIKQPGSIAAATNIELSVLLCYDFIYLKLFEAGESCVDFRLLWL